MEDHQQQDRCHEVEGMNRFTKSPYPDPDADIAYFRWGIKRKVWSEQGVGMSNGSSLRATRYRDWYRKAYIGTKPLKYVNYHGAQYPDFRAFMKSDLIVCRKRWKVMNTRTAYLYWRDFGA